MNKRYKELLEISKDTKSEFSLARNRSISRVGKMKMFFGHHEYEKLMIKADGYYINLLLEYVFLVKIKKELLSIDLSKILRILKKKMMRFYQKLDNL